MFHMYLPVAGTEIWWPGIVLLGLSIGFLTGLFGVGGGFILTPSLNILFGIPYPIAIGSGLAQIFVIGGISAWKHWKNGNMDFKLGLIMAGGSLWGTEIGVRFLKMINGMSNLVIHQKNVPILDLIMNGLFLILMSAVAITILIETAGKVENEETASSYFTGVINRFDIPPLVAFQRSNIHSISIWIPLLVSMLVGILTGLLGVGGGFINFPILIYFMGVPTTMAVGTSAFQIILSTGYGAIRYSFQNQVDFYLVLLLLAGSMLGVQAGVYTSRLLGGQMLRRNFCWVIFLGMAILLFDLFRKLL